MRRLAELLTLWLIGGAVYYGIEMLWRGYSHPSMFIVGGLCFLAVGAINNCLSWELGIVWQSLIGAGIITVVELVAGIVFNVWLGLGVWDYSALPLNFMGQICLWFTLLWIPIAAFAIWLDDWCRHILFRERRPRYTWF